VKLPDAKRVSAAAAAAATASRNKRLRRELKARGWVILRIQRNGHCLFESIARAFKIYRPELQLSMFQTRWALADKMKELKGVIPNFPIQMFAENESKELVAKIQLHRNDKVETIVTLDQYCDLLGSSLYGGQEEMVLLANMYKLKLTVYDQQQSLDGSDPQTFLQNFLLAEDHPDNAGNMSRFMLNFIRLPCCDYGIQVHPSTCYLREEPPVEPIIIRSCCARMQNMQSLCHACPYGMKIFVSPTVAKKVAGSRQCRKPFTRVTP
jgi:hypothetical protein